MRKFKDQQRSVTDRVLIAMLCDFCGAAIDWRKEANRPGERVDAVTIAHEQTVCRKPGDWNVRKLEVDCCGSCWARALKLLSQLLPVGHAGLKYMEMEFDEEES
jgi:hypothetical protein